jgi:hypothetical protein
VEGLAGGLGFGLNLGSGSGLDLDLGLRGFVFSGIAFILLARW